MRISTNTIGNYTINARPQQVNTVNQAKMNITESAEVSKSEKEFFSSMYPEKRSEIVNYHYYGSSGSLSGVALGQNLDRKM